MWKNWNFLFASWRQVRLTRRNSRHIITFFLHCRYSVGLGHFIPPGWTRFLPASSRFSIFSGLTKDPLSDGVPWGLEQHNQEKPPHSNLWTQLSKYQPLEPHIVTCLHFSVRLQRFPNFNSMIIQINLRRIPTRRINFLHILQLWMVPGVMHFFPRFIIRIKDIT